MYAPYFGLSQEPFSIAPDPRYLYMSERHREALAHLTYGLGAGGGFVLLTGEIGTGKTTVCRCFLEQVPEHCNVAYIFNPKLTVPELLQSICDEFGIAVPGPASARTVKDYLDPLNAFLLEAHAQGRTSVLVIDEAQNLSADVLEQLRLLTNLETSERKLLQVVLIGQPELRTLLARPELEQLAQRVVARFHLDALAPAETADYVRHRLEVAGLARALPFERAALALVHRLTGGVPRRINLLCDRALLGAFARSEAAVSRPVVRQAAREVFPRATHRPPAGRVRPVWALALGLAAGAGLWALAQAWLLQPSRSLLPLPSQERAAAPAPALVAAAPAAPASAAAASGTGPEPPAPVPTTAVVAAAQPAASPPSLLRDEKQAWRELARAWGAEVGEAADPCVALAREGLHCFGREMPLALIRQLDRPGIVTLDRDSGRPAYAVLTSVGERTATLSAAGSTQTVTLAALGARWSGEWATLWRSAPGTEAKSAEAVAAGMARWAAAHLPGDAASPVTARTRSFQLAQGLPADGRLGPLTYMQLNRSAGAREPRLQPLP